MKELRRVHSREAGFTLVELVVALAVVAIAAGMAAMIVADVLPSVHEDGTR